jgi:protoporphyrinogen oxidase
MEYWCNPEDPLWTESDDALVHRATQEILQTGLIGTAKILDGKVIRVSRCYPVYAKNYRRHVDTITSYLDTFQGLTPIGRYGAFKYNNQDHSILMGILAAENLVLQRRHDLWTVNTDYETYQESATITQAGLVPLS